MNTNRRRIISASASSGINTEFLTLVLDESDAVNVHGLRVCFSYEPEVGDANANGFWIVWCLPAGQIGNTGLPNTLTELNVEDSNPYIWGVGCFTASNQAPYHMEFAPMTSRNCQKGARIVLELVTLGLTAGNARKIMITTCFTS